MKKRPNASDYVYNEIKKEIMLLELLPGQTVNEIETADRFHVSRTPIRDAFRRLEVEGLIEVRRGNGTYVSLIDIDEIDDIIYMREILERAIVKEIGPLSKSQEIKLELLLSKQKKLLESDLDELTLSKKFLELDNELHETIFRMANKINVWKRISNDRPHYNRLRVLTNLYSRHELEKLYREHALIIESIINQDYKKLDEFYKEHLYRGMDSLPEIISKNPEYFTGSIFES